MEAGMLEAMRTQGRFSFFLGIAHCDMNAPSKTWGRLQSIPHWRRAPQIVPLYDCSPKEISTQNDKVKRRCGDGKVAIIDGKERDGKKYYLRSARERFDMKARASVVGVENISGDLAILSFSKSPPPEMIMPGCKCRGVNAVSK